MFARAPDSAALRSPLLPGQLDRSTLGDVLGTLTRARANGVLSVTESAGPRSGFAHTVHLVDGAPRAVASDGAPLGQMLAGVGAVTSSRLAAALARQAAGDARLLGELLCDLGGPQQLVLEAMRRQTRERLAALFALRRASLRFRAALFADVVPGSWVRAARTAPSLQAAEFLHGRPRARVRVKGDEPLGAPLNEYRRQALLLLGLDERADPLTIRSAYKRRVLAVHPDHATSDEDRLERTRVLARLTSAYQRLSLHAGAASR